MLLVILYQAVIRISTEKCKIFCTLWHNRCTFSGSLNFMQTVQFMVKLLQGSLVGITLKNVIRSNLSSSYQGQLDLRIK